MLNLRAWNSGWSNIETCWSPMPTRTLTFAPAVDGTSAKVARKAVMVRVRVFFIEVSNAPEGGLVALGGRRAGCHARRPDPRSRSPGASDHHLYAGAPPIASHAQRPDAPVAV